MFFYVYYLFIHKSQVKYGSSAPVSLFIHGFVFVFLFIIRLFASECEFVFVLFNQKALVLS